MSVATGTIDPTIVDDLIALPDKPAAAAQPGASGQWQMLQPAGRPPAAPEAKIKGISASNDLWIGARRLPRSSSLTGSGGLCPADSPAGPAHEGLISSPQGGSVLPSTPCVLGSLMQGATGTEGPCPSRGLGAMASAQPLPVAHARGSDSWASRLVPKPSPASPSGQTRVGCPCFIATSHSGSRGSGAQST